MNGDVTLADADHGHDVGSQRQAVVCGYRLQGAHGVGQHAGALATAHLQSTALQPAVRQPAAAHHSAAAPPHTTARLQDLLTHYTGQQFVN